MISVGNSATVWSFRLVEDTNLPGQDVWDKDRDRDKDRKFWIKIRMNIRIQTVLSKFLDNQQEICR